MYDLKKTSTLYANNKASLIEALEAVRLFRKEGEGRHITINLTSDIFLDSLLEIDIENITINGCNNRIIGGILIDNWQSDTFNAVACMSAALPDGDWNFTDLWVNGCRANAPRYPKEGFLEILDSEVNNTTNFYDSSNWIIAKTSDLNHLGNLENTIINYYHFWVDEHSPIKSYDSNSGKLVMEYPSRFRITTKEGDFGRIKYYLTHIATTFGSENEWYLDRKKGKVYYVGAVTEALAPTIPQLFKITAHNVRIINAELTCTRGDYVSVFTTPRQNITTELGFASDIQSVCSAPGAVIFENAKNCTISDCILHGIGIHGIEIKTGCEAIRIENNRIYDLGAGGIKISGGAYGCPSNEITSHCVIRRNEISDCGKRYNAGCGILAMHTSYLEIDENHIHHMDYSAISSGWVWGYLDSSSYCNMIKRNYIHHIGMGMLSDLGGIYLVGPQPGTMVSENRIHDVYCSVYGGHGIYTDEGSTDILIENNVVYNIKSACFSQHFGKNNTVRNNIFVFGKQGNCNITRIEEHTTVVFENNICVTDGATIYRKADGITTIKSDNNLFWDISGNCSPPPYGSFEEWQVEGKDNNSIISDPLFADIEHYDFTLTPDSPAIKLGFKPIIGFPAKELN